MTNTIKFSQFTEANLNDTTTETVGLATGLNIKTPKIVTWTTMGRPTPPPSWVIGANTDLAQYEFWDPISSSWIQLASAVDLTSTFILETPDLSLPNSFALSTLSTGILKSTTGTGVPSISVPLTSIDSLVTAANEIIYTTAPNVYAVTALSPFSRGLLADTTSSAWRTDLGVPAIPVSVGQGGTGNTTFTAFSVITAGTTPTGPFQNVAGVGLAGQALTSNGPGLLPTWQTSPGSGTVNPGLINQVAYYAAAGSAVSGLATANNGVLVTSNSGVPSISSTLPSAVQLNITNLGTITTGVWNGSLIPLAFGGTNANLIASNGGIVWSNASQMQILSGTATAGQVLVSGSNSAPSWSTATFPTSVGSAGTVIRSNGANWVASTAAFADTYLTNNLLYSNGANNVVGLATAANGVLITSGGGVPSISSTLPSAVQGNITTVGTITSGVWQGSDINVPFGGTGNVSFTAYSVICAGTTATGNFQNVVGVGTLGQVLTSQGAGVLPQWTTVPGTGTINSGTINDLAYYAANGTTISALATAANGTLITSAGGVPSISSTLPTAVQGNITSVGTITSGVWNGSPVTVPFGGTGDASFTAYSVICAGTTSTGNFQNVVGLGSVGQVLTSAGAGALPTWTNAPGTGTINSGGINQVVYYAAAGTTLSGLATANDGLLVTSNTGVPSILAGPGTTGNILQSNAAASPSFSTATYPSIATSTGTILRANGTNWVPSTATFADTYTTSGLLYSSGSSNVVGLATANNGMLVTSASGVPSILAGPGTTGNILQSNAAAAPSFSIATFPGTSGTAGTILRSNGTNWVNSTSTFADTYGINTILYNASANTVSGLATAASGVLVTSAGGVPSISTTLPSGLTIPGFAASGANADITSLIGLTGTLRAPTGVTSSAGLNLLTFTYTASAVNYIGVINNTTGNAPAVFAAGSDTNVILQLSGQGTGGASVQGTGTNNNATAGFVGEYGESVIAAASAVTFTNTVVRDLTSISLTAGDWDVWGNIAFPTVGGTAPSQLACWISSTSASTPDQSLIGQIALTVAGGVLAAGNGVNAPQRRFSLSTTTTIYISGVTVATSGNATGCGRICARRRR